ncbi:MAG: LapD/MoxY N-terminal periplasmic domain-containing protein [Gammaproteobacteria bacterium]
MSLLRQLWMSVIVAMALLLVVLLVVSVATARSYLQQQLVTQAANGAASLALSMSQLGSDPAMAETLINAMFDSGYYRRIRYLDVEGRTVVERTAEKALTSVPTWFARLAPIAVEPGEALVSAGWRQAGRVTVEPHTRYALAALWSGAVRTALVLLIAGVLWGIAVTLMMRRIRRPLDEMAEQAEAIGDGRFQTLAEPRVTELRSVARALNRMAERVRNLFGEQAERISQLREEVSRDPVTGLHNRGFFTGELRRMLSEETAPESGALLLVRLERLGELNRRLGHQKTDALLGEIGERLVRLAGEGSDTLVARLNGPDFAILLEGGTMEAARNMASEITGWEVDELGEAEETAFSAGVTDFHRGEDVGAVMARADNALMRAQNSGRAEMVPSGQALRSPGEIAWRQTLETALAGRRFRLDFFPVLRLDGALVHREAMLRLIDEKGAVLSAGHFMPAARRVGLSADCDLTAVALALEEMGRSVEPVAVNLSPDSLLAPGFLSRLQQLLGDHPDEAQRLSLEVSERGLESHLGGMEALADLLDRFGCRLGLEHFGQRLSALPKLYALRLGYLKIDGVFVAGVEGNEGNRKLVTAIVSAARGLDIEPYAEQVHTPDEWDTLASLGVVGMTGPEATRRAES